MSKQYYIDGFKNFNTNSDQIFKNNAPKFPAYIINKIKNQTIDSYPWNLRMLYENNLNYLPRPIIQSYTSYTPNLENLNFEFYSSKNAPEYVIYEYGALDNRYPLFDESKVNIILKENYQVDEVFDYENRKLILLKKKQDFKTIKFVQTKEYAILLNRPFIPEKDVYYQIEVYENIIGKSYSIIKHAPNLTLKIQTENAGKYEYKTSKKLLESGIFGNNFLAETNDFFDICTKGESKNKVKYYEIVAKDPIFFKEKIRVKEFKIIIE